VSFQWPIALVLLLLVPVLAGLYVLMQRRRRRYALRYASVALVQQAVGTGPGIRRHIPAGFYLLALTAMIVALARPQANVPVLQNTGTLVITIDVSGSMFAQDVAPDRMEATKKAVREFVNKQPDGVKIGVVSFSDNAALVAPPTEERKPVLDAVARLQPQRGTNMGAGLQLALDAIYQDADLAPPRVPNSPLTGPLARPTATPTPAPSAEAKPPAASIVLVSDGQSNTGPDPLAVAQEAVAAGVKVYTIGIGTPQGTILQIQGRNVFTRLDEDTLRAISDQTDGKYFNAQNESDLQSIYDELSRERKFEDKEQEITYALAGLALLLSVIAGGLGLLWFNRLP
jgi:Ca-activated chloride channel family protein